MKPEPRDYVLLQRIVSALMSDPESIVHVNCFNMDEINLIETLVPDHLKSRVQYSYMEFYEKH